MRSAILTAVVLAGLGVASLGFYNWIGLFKGLFALDIYAAEGCVIAPDVPRPTSAKTALAMGQAQEQEHEDWLLIGPAFCTIVPPKITAIAQSD